MNVYLVGAKNPETRRQVLAQSRANPEFQVAGYIDNDERFWHGSMHGWEVFGGFDVVPGILAADDDAWFVNLITGSTTARFETSRRLASMGCRFTNLVHPSVDTTDVELGVGLYVQEVVIQAGAVIGDNASIHVGAVIAHEAQIGASCFIAHEVSVSGEVVVGDGTFIGTNASIAPRVKIGAWSTVGAGCVVVRDIPSGATVVGNPGRVIRESRPLFAGGRPFGP